MQDAFWLWVSTCTWLFPHHFSKDVEMHGKQMGKIPQLVGMLHQTHVEPWSRMAEDRQTGSQQTKADG